MAIVPLVTVTWMYCMIPVLTVLKLITMKTNMQLMSKR